MKDKDQHLLWEAYLEKHTPKHKEEDEKKEKKGKYDDGDGKKERCDYVPCEEENVQEEEIYGAEGAEEEDEDVKEEGAREDMLKVMQGRTSSAPEPSGDEVGLDSIHDAIRNLEGDLDDDGDWEGAIRQVMDGLAERVIYHAKEGNGGVVGDPDLADRWDFKTGVKDAIEDLLDPQTYGDLSSGFKKAFHRAKRDEDSGRFDFSNDALLAKMRANSEHDDAPLSYPRERENQDLNNLGL